MSKRLSLVSFLIVVLLIPGLETTWMSPRVRSGAHPNVRCTQDSDCNSSMMYCNGKNYKDPFCDCTVFHTWSGEYHQCVGLVKTSCHGGRLCVKNAFCNASSDWCECKEGYIPTKTLRCALPYGSTCEPGGTDICNRDQFFVCNSNTHRCDCEFPTQMTYDETVRECRMLLNEPCEAIQNPVKEKNKGSEPVHKCVKGAVCRTKHGGDKIGKCYCKDEKENELMLTHRKPIHYSDCFQAEIGNDKLHQKPNPLKHQMISSVPLNGPDNHILPEHYLDSNESSAPFSSPNVNLVDKSTTRPEFHASKSDQISKASSSLSGFGFHYYNHLAIGLIINRMFQILFTHPGLIQSSS